MTSPALQTSLRGVLPSYCSPLSPTLAFYLGGCLHLLLSCSALVPRGKRGSSGRCPRGWPLSSLLRFYIARGRSSQLHPAGMSLPRSSLIWAWDIGPPARPRFRPGSPPGSHTDQRRSGWRGPRCATRPYMERRGLRPGLGRAVGPCVLGRVWLGLALGCTCRHSLFPLLFAAPQILNRFPHFKLLRVLDASIYPLLSHTHPTAT